MKEPTEIDAILKPSPPGAPAARDVWTDADLAASAQRAGMRQVSCEAGFARVKDGERLILTTV